MDSTQTVSTTERQHSAARIDLETRVAETTERVFADLVQAGVWKGDPKRVAGTVARYSLSLLERGWVKTDVAA